MQGMQHDFRCEKEYNKHNRCVHKSPSKVAPHKNKIRQRKRTWQGMQISDEPEMICVEPQVEDMMHITDDEQEMLHDEGSKTVLDKEGKFNVE